jgi:small-conductance mechanosensitive channel
MHSARRNYNVQNLTPIVYTSVESSGVRLTVRYLCHPRMRRNSSQDFWEGILEQFSENEDINFAYPTYRYYNNDSKSLNNQLSREGEERKYE